MSVIPIRKLDEKISVREMLDAVLLEAHLREVYGLDEWEEYFKMINYVEELKATGDSW